MTAAGIAEKNLNSSRTRKRRGFAAEDVAQHIGGLTMKIELAKGIITYKMSLNIFRKMLGAGIITREDYVRAEEILAKNNLVSLSSIYRDKP